MTLMYKRTNIILTWRTWKKNKWDKVRDANIREKESIKIGDLEIIHNFR